MSEDNTLEKSIIPDAVIDAKGLHSPVPLLRLKREMATRNAGETVRIDCTDSSCGEDISNWCTRMSCTMQGKQEQAEYTSFFITK